MRRFPFASLVVASVLGLSSYANIAVAGEGKLKVGDPAPALAVSHWLHGAEVKGFEPGRFYVVEFWATWCGPCTLIMPHMGDLQDEYRSQGVTFIGFTSEANDQEAKVRAFVAKHGAKLGYRFAFGSGSETHNAYMTASGQKGIPCSFVVDKGGKIAYIGHPLFLDFVLPKVLDGTWDATTGAETLKAADKDFDAAYEAMSPRSKDTAAGLQAHARFAAKWPVFANNVYMNPLKLGLLVEGKHLPEAKELAEKLITKAVARGDESGLSHISAALRGDATNGDAELTALAVKAAEAAHEVDRENVALALNLLDVYASAGDRAKVKEFGPKVVAAAKAAVENDRDARGTMMVADAYFKSGDKEQAKATAEKALKMLDPANVRFRNYLEAQAKMYGAVPEKR
jgi:thiol-disulfide isomerase/thioredoxin